MILEEQIIAHEEIRLKVYRCPAGKLTIGIGRNLEDVGISQTEARYLLNNDILRCRTGLSKALSYWHTLSNMRQRVLIDMAINLGIHGLLDFKKMLGALRKSDYELAADEMLASLWAHQVKERARWLAAAMRLDREPTDTEIGE